MFIIGQVKPIRVVKNRCCSLKADAVFNFVALGFFSVPFVILINYRCHVSALRLEVVDGFHNVDNFNGVIDNVNDVVE